MKRVNYVFLIATNIDEEANPDFLLKIEEQVHQIMSDYKLPEADLETSANGKVNVSIDTTDTEINNFGDLRLYGYLICNDDVKQTGISDDNYEWFSKEIISIVEHILRPNAIKVIPDVTEDECGGYLKIYLDDVKDYDFLDGCIDDIDEYEE